MNRLSGRLVEHRSAGSVLRVRGRRSLTCAAADRREPLSGQAVLAGERGRISGHSVNQRRENPLIALSSSPACPRR